MALKITATTLETFQNIQRQVELINNEELIKKFDSAEYGVVGLQLQVGAHQTTDKLFLPKGFKINWVRVEQRNENLYGNEATYFFYDVSAKFTPQDENEKSFDVVMKLKNRDANIDIRAFN